MSDNEVMKNASDDEDNFNPRAHKRLLAGVSNLQPNQLIYKATRNEPSLKRDEFHLIKPTSTDEDIHTKSKVSNQVNVLDLINVLDKTNKHLDLGKSLRKTVNKKKVLPKPLEKPAAEKLQRSINYEKAKIKLDRWDAIVAKQRSADHLSFPLNQDVSSMQIRDSVQLPSKFRIKSEMMMEMEKIEPEIFQIKTPDDLADQQNDEDEPKLTREEMIQRSRELRALRIKESQKSIKAHHQNKIKSKKYHRVLKKEKMKQQIKEFELLQKTDPEAALQKMEQLDRSRVEERATLRHRNTGTWAKNLQVRAKFDKDARKDLADQIAISREMTAKKPIDESDDDDVELENENGEMSNHDPFNPWLKNGGTSNSNGNTEVDAFMSGYRKYWQERNQNEKDFKEYHEQPAGDEIEENESGESAEVNGNSIKEKKKKISRTKAKTIEQLKTKTKGKRSVQRKSKLNPGWIEEDISPSECSKNTENIEDAEDAGDVEIAGNLDDLFDHAEDVKRQRIEKNFKKMANEILHPSKKNKRKHTENDNSDDEDVEHPQFDLGFKKQNQRVQLDEELNNDDHIQDDQHLQKLKANKTESLKTIGTSGSGTAANTNTMDDSENINPDDIAKVKPQHLHTALPDTIYTNDDDGFNEYDDAEYHFDNSDEKKLTIAEAFEDDDIVAEFKREKDDEAKKNGPQEIDLSLPGWGSWGGAGIDPNKQKPKRKMILKFPAPEKRRLDNQGNVVIIENRDEQLRKHLVANLPFPFTSVDDYEQSIRQPIGKDFVPATAHKVLTKPALTTKSGTIIEPMNETMLVKPAKRPVTKTERRIAKMVGDD